MSNQLTQNKKGKCSKPFEALRNVLMLLSNISRKRSLSKAVKSMIGKHEKSKKKGNEVELNKRKTVTTWDGKKHFIITKQFSHKTIYSRKLTFFRTFHI